MSVIWIHHKRQEDKLNLCVEFCVSLCIKQKYKFNHSSNYRAVKNTNKKVKGNLYGITEKLQSIESDIKQSWYLLVCMVSSTIGSPMHNIQMFKSKRFQSICTLKFSMSVGSKES